MGNKRIVILIIAVLAILTGVVFFGYNEAGSDIENNNDINIIEPNETITKEPAIEIIPDSFDLGTVIYGDIASHTFTIKNRGKSDLEILRLSTSCGCTKATIAEEDKIIAPNESVDMLVTFDPAVHKDNSDLGDLTRIVYIKTNDPNNPEIEVEIEAYVIKNNK